MQTVAFSGGSRTAFGKKGTKALRKEGLIPCVMYGGDEVRHFTTKKGDVKSLIYTPEFKTAEVDYDGAKYRCIVQDVQYHPLTDEILHIDFLQLVDGQSVNVQLPVRFYGNSPGIKSGGKLMQNLRRIKIKTTPEHLRNELKVSIEGLQLGQAVRVKDIDVSDNDNVQIMTSLNTPVASVEVPRALKSAEAAAEKEGGDAEGEEEGGEE